MLQGVKLSCRFALVFAAPPAHAAQDLLEGPPHVVVPEGIDDGIEEGVALGQHQEVLLEDQHHTLLTAQTVEQQHHQARRPADHKTACWGTIERAVGGQRRRSMIHKSKENLKKELLRGKKMNTVVKNVKKYGNS